jgi:flagellin-like protein
VKANRKFSKDEEAVSPVIGVILMVAITVILAAVIAAFVFGMGGSLKKNYTVAATASQTDANTIDFTYQGGPDDYLVAGLNYSVGSGSRVQVTGDVAPGLAWSDNNATLSRDHVVVSAYFADGTEQVILDTYV